MKKLLLISILISSNYFFSQDDQTNLVLNPSFESIDGKLKKLKQINVATDWDSPTALKADLFSKKKEGAIGTPINQYGKEHAKDGGNYAGVVAYSYNNKQPRTYLQSKLLNPLSAGLDYCVKFHLSLSDLSKYAIDNIGIHFGEDPLALDNKGDIIFNNRAEFSHIVKDNTNKKFNERYNWETVCGVYRADGKEKFITIGNFFNNKDTKYEKLKKLDKFPGSQIPLAYYYIDKVEVFMVENLSECDCMDGASSIKRESIVYHRDFADNGEELSTEQVLSRATVYFDVEIASIDDVFVKSLNSLTEFLKANPALKVQLNGHTDKAEKDAIKNDPENEKLINLGEYRAKSIQQFFVNKGISKDRFTVQNFEASQPASPGLSMLSLAKNRRVEFKIVE